MTNPSVLIEATSTARDHLAALDLAVSRFRSDSEVSVLARKARRGPVTGYVSPIFADYLRASFRAALLTDGLVDPTVGAALSAAGYDADLDIVRRRGVTTAADPAPTPGWKSLQLDSATDQLRSPQGTLIDLGASAKAHAADTIARLLATSLPGGFLVNLGGDISTSGDVPEGGWRVGIETADGTVIQVVEGRGQAFATSSTQRRTWRTTVGEAHHIIDPRTGRCAQTPWAQVTCAGATALEANAASTAALILASSAPAWLEERGVPARLDGTDSAVVTTAGWPTPADRQESVA